MDFFKKETTTNDIYVFTIFVFTSSFDQFYPQESLSGFLYFILLSFFITFIISSFYNRSCDESKGICSFPSAHVQLTKKQQLLMVGQPYKVNLHLEMPESPTNRELGMFFSEIDNGNYIIFIHRGFKLYSNSFSTHFLYSFFSYPFIDDRL